MPDLPSNQSSNIVAGSGMTITFTETEGGYWAITFTSSGGAGHTIQDDDSALTARTNLSFQDGFVLTDDAGGDQTEVDLSYGAAGYPVDVSDTEADGTAITVARSDHAHSGAAYLKEADFDDIDFLVGTATAHTAAEIVVGTAPGGELGGTWATPTVDATHSGSAHHAQSHAHSAAGDGTTLTPAVLNLPASATPAQTADGQAVWDSDGDFLTVGDGTARQTFLPVIDATSDPLAVSTAAADGTEATMARKDHVHPHEAAHINHDTTWAAKGNLIVATANDAASVLTVGADDTVLMARAAEATGVVWQAPATTAEIADVAETEAAGTSDTWARGDHAHSGNLYVQEGDAWLPVTFSKEGALTVGTGSIRWYNDTGRALTVVSARGSVGTAPTGASILIDVNEGGTSLWNTTQANRITIAVSTNTDEGGAFDDASLADGGFLTVDIDQIGSTVPGSDLSVTIWLR